MAKIGLKYPVAAPIQSEPVGTAPTYGSGFVIGKAVSANKNITSNDNPLYGDDAIAENDTSFQQGTLELNVTDFGTDSETSLNIQARMLGHTVVTTGTGTDAVTSMVKKAGDNAPNLGVGYYKTKILNNVKMYEGTWLYKVKFQLPSETANTKGQSIEWQTSAINGRIMSLSNNEDTYEETAIFNTEAKAIEWLNAKANITAESNDDSEPIGG